jgi:hypothetical protein
MALESKYKHFRGDFCCAPLCSGQQQKDKYLRVLLQVTARREATFAVAEWYTPWRRMETKAVN